MDENDLDIVIAVFHLGRYIDKKNEIEVIASVPKMEKRDKIGWLLKLQHLESDSSYIKKLIL